MNSEAAAMVAASQQTTVHVFAIGEDYIELILEPPGEPLKRALESGGSRRMQWTRSKESTSWCFCSRCPAMAGQTCSCRECIRIDSNCANKNSSAGGGVFYKEKESGTVDWLKAAAYTIPDVHESGRYSKYS